MPADLELGAAITVEDTSELDDLTADAGVEGDAQGGQAAGGGLGAAGGIMETLGSMKGLLKAATVALGILVAVPNLLSGLMRLVKVALLPIGVLFQSLLAPLIQRLLKWLVQNNIIGMVQRFAQRIVTAITNFIAGLQPLINAIKDFAGVSPNTEEEGIPFDLTEVTGPGGSTVQQAIEQTEERNVERLKDPNTTTLSEQFATFVDDLLNPESETTSTSRDSYASEASAGQTQEEGPS